MLNRDLRRWVLYLIKSCVSSMYSLFKSDGASSFSEPEDLPQQSSHSPQTEPKSQVLLQNLQTDTDQQANTLSPQGKGQPGKRKLRMTGMTYLATPFRRGARGLVRTFVFSHILNAPRTLWEQERDSRIALTVWFYGAGWHIPLILFDTEPMMLLDCASESQAPGRTASHHVFLGDLCPRQGPEILSGRSSCCTGDCAHLPEITAGAIAPQLGAKRVYPDGTEGARSHLCRKLNTG